MILSRGRRYLFIHAPKTGGTSLSLALENRAMKDDIMLGDTPKAVRRRGRVKDVQTSGRLWKHSMISDLYGLVDQAEIEALFVFTLVRNPWDRAVSYYHWLQAQSFDHPAVTLSQSLDFSAFLNHPQNMAAMKAAPYGRYVRDRDGVDRCDLYLRLEHLDQDLTPLEDHLGFRLGPLQRVNASARDADYRDYYSSADAALLARLCAEDIARFGYQFD